ncbi:MAG: type I restriction endonuclease, partial [Methanobacteriota archaeon]
MDREAAKKKIIELVDKYNKVVEENTVAKYNEEMTKIGFIQPLFRALGWEFENSSEVTAEETISKKRVDYGFRINGIPKFFLEAKALKADLNNPQFAEQAINYAWHKDCTWAVLTDFESLMIFNAEWKTENLLLSRLISMSCNEFFARFDDLWLLSRESFEQGLIDREAEKR